VLHGDAGVISILDVADPSSPALLAQYTLTGEYTHEVWGVAVTDDTLWVGVDWSLQAIDVSVPASPVLLSELPMGGRVAPFLIDGNLAYVGCAGIGAKVVDISDPSQPEVVRTYAVNGATGGVALNRDHVYIPTGGAGMAIFAAGAPGVTGVCVQREYHYNLPAPGDEDFGYCVEVEGNELTRLELTTPWGGAFDSADYVGPVWDGAEYDYEVSGFEFDAYLEGGERHLDVAWRELSAGQWASLDTADTDLTVAYTGGSWAATADFTGVLVPAEAPQITYPTHGETAVPLSPTFQWTEWTSPAPSALVGLGLEEVATGDDIYEDVYLSTDTISWTPPEALDPVTEYECSLVFVNYEQAPVNGVDVEVVSYTESDVEFTTAAPGVTGVWVERGDEHKYPALGDEDFEYKVHVAGVELTGLEVTTPWGEAFDSADYLPPAWDGSDFETGAGILWLRAGTEQGLRYLDVEWWGLSSGQWADLDTGNTTLTAYYSGGDWTATVDFDGVLVPSQVPQMIYPTHVQTGVELTPTFEWSLWTSPDVCAGLWYELENAGTGEDLYGEEPCPADMTSWTPPAPLDANTEYDWGVNFYNCD